YSPSFGASASAEPGAPSTTADGEPSWPASVSSSRVTFLTVSPDASTTTSTSAMPATPYTNFSDTRYPTSRTPPSPESTTLLPPCRGGRLPCSTTTLDAPVRPTSPGAMPRSASVRVSTGFFLAAMMPLNEGYRGSLIVSQTLTTAGVPAVTTSYPSSVCRSIVSVDPSTVSLRAPVSAAMPSRSASMCGITWTRPSVDSAPHSTRSGDSWASAAASTRDVASAHEPCSAASETWTAESGPIDRALRIDSVAPSGPIVSTTTSPPC